MRVGRLGWGSALLLWAVGVLGATLEVRVDHPPATGAVVAWVFDSPNTFVDLRDPVRTVVFPERGATPGLIMDLPAGEYALVGLPGKQFDQGVEHRPRRADARRGLVCLLYTARCV